MGKTYKEIYHEQLQTKEWKDFREKALQHYNGICMICGAKATEIHHPVYRADEYGRRRKPWEYKFNEVIALCSEHHHRYHFVGGKFRPISSELNLLRANPEKFLDIISEEIEEITVGEIYDYLCEIKCSREEAYQIIKDCSGELAIRLSPRGYIYKSQRNAEIMRELWLASPDDREDVFHCGYHAIEVFDSYMRKIYPELPKRGRNTIYEAFSKERLEHLHNMVEEDPNDERTKTKWDFWRPKCSNIKRIEGIYVRTHEYEKQKHNW